MTTTEPAPQRLPHRLAAEWRAGRMVWRREVIRFVRSRTQVLVSLLQPLLFLYVLGIGLSRLVAGSGGGGPAGREYLLFLFPGVLVMAAQGPAVSVGASIVWDRSSGFLRGMLAAPVLRGTLLLGKCLGGATVATAQGAVVLLTAGLAGVPYRVDLFALLIGELVLAALAMTVLTALAAVVVRRAQAFNTVLTVLFTPLIFLSGLMFPISAMPPWMAALTLANPLTYVVDGMRHTIAAHLGTPAGSTIFTPVTWAGWQVPAPVELATVLAFTTATLLLAAHHFTRRP